MEFDNVHVGQYVYTDMFAPRQHGRVTELHAERRVVSVKWDSGRVGLLCPEDIAVDDRYQQPKPKAQIVTLTNSFHGTEIRVRKESADLLDVEDAYVLTPAQKATVRRIRRTLCPSYASGCACGVVRS